MRITGLSLDDFQLCTDRVSALRYSGNIDIHQDAHERTTNRDGTPQCTARLRARDSHGPGARTSASGRHGPYACWHAYRDVLTEVFARFPDAVIVSGNGWRVTYRKAAGFQELYPGTARVNLGSRLEPVYMPELCQCEETPHAPMQYARFNPYPLQYTRAHFNYAAVRYALRYTTHPDESIREIANRLATDHQMPEQVRNTLNEILGERLARYASRNLPTVEQMDVFRAGSSDNECSADYVSPAVARAARVQATSAKLLGGGDPAADPIVFGPEYAPGNDPKRYSRLT